MRLLQQHPLEQVEGERRFEQGDNKVPLSFPAETRGHRAAAGSPDSCLPAAGRRSGPAGHTGSCGAAGAPGGTASLGSAG